MMANYKNSNNFVIYDAVEDRKREPPNKTPANIALQDPVTLRGAVYSNYCVVDLRTTFGTEAWTLIVIEFYSSI